VLEVKRLLLYYSQTHCSLEFKNLYLFVQQDICFAGLRLQSQSCEKLLSVKIWQHQKNLGRKQSN